ncbi:MAG TPA: hypothetical protein VFE33_17920 [Thermoanaerobaculia bacterium]|nr:hypothetical protein [Thermoanaerobaculia bacterium]
MRTTEALLEFVLIGALALFLVLCAVLLEVVQPPPELANLLADKAFLGGGIYLVLFLSASYLLGLVVNTLCKKLFRPQDRWIRSIELQRYAGSLKFRKLIRSLGLGIEDYECVDPLVEVGWLQKWLLLAVGLALGPAARANARTLERCYRVVGQLPFAAMATSNAAHADISIQRATVRISRNSALVCGIAAVWLLMRAALLGRSSLWAAFIICAALAAGCFFSFLQRARWYALDSIKYALAGVGDGEERKIVGVVIDLGGVLTRDIREPLFADLIRAYPALSEIAVRVSGALCGVLVFRSHGTTEPMNGS